ncbi:MAG: S8 family serine peptidase, partial [Candidatus Hermodarchaeota archaeon]
MKGLKKVSLVLIILIFLTINPVILSNLFLENNKLLLFTTQTDREIKLHTSNINETAVIVFFNESTYNIAVVNRFEFYGGSLNENENWNGIFNAFSGFAGIIPTENITSFRNEFPDINIDIDEIVNVQMNYASVQIQSINSTWYVNGYNGIPGSSTAVLDSGVNPNQDFLQGKISGWQNFVDQKPVSDDNGHGTFISSVIAGTGSSSNSSNIPSRVNLYGNYSHFDLFKDYLPSKNYTLKVFTTNFSRVNSKISINTTVNFNPSEIDQFWIELYNAT